VRAGSAATAGAFEGDVARLRRLATDMRAVALHADAQRLQRAQKRAGRRWEKGAPADDGQMRMSLGRDRHAPRRWETPELRRLRVRDELLRRGEHPGLSGDVFRAAWDAAGRHETGSPSHGDPSAYRLPDGLTARAQRYQRETADGRWALPTNWPDQPPKTS
jgi:hypothetical protein